MITFTRNTMYEIELDASTSRELRSFLKALRDSGEDIHTEVCQNDSKGGLARFPLDSRLVPLLPPIGSTWKSSEGYHEK